MIVLRGTPDVGVWRYPTLNFHHPIDQDPFLDTDLLQYNFILLIIFHLDNVSNVAVTPYFN